MWFFGKEESLEKVLELTCLDATVPGKRFLSVPASASQASLHDFLTTFAEHEGDSGRLSLHSVQKKPVPSAFYYWSAADFEIILPRAEDSGKAVASTSAYFEQDDVQKIFRECVKPLGTRNRAHQLDTLVSLMKRGHHPIVEPMRFKAPSRKYSRLSLEVDGSALGCRTYGQLRADFSRGQLFSAGVAYDADVRFEHGKFTLAELALYAYAGFSTEQTKSGISYLSFGYIMKITHDGQNHLVSVHTEPHLLQGVERGKEFERIEEIGKKEFVVALDINGVKALRTYRDFMKIIAQRESTPIYEFLSTRDFFVKI